MTRARKKKKRSRKKATTRLSPNTPAAAATAAPRPRVKLPEAMRAVGLDEQSVAQCLAEQIKQLKTGGKGQKRIPRKLLLDYLKECVRILYAPARRGDAPEQPAKIELVHFVPRPDRSNDRPSGAGT